MLRSLASSARRFSSHRRPGPRVWLCHAEGRDADPGRTWARCVSDVQDGLGGKCTFHHLAGRQVEARAS